MEEDAICVKEEPLEEKFMVETGLLPHDNIVSELEEEQKFKIEQSDIDDSVDDQEDDPLQAQGVQGDQKTSSQSRSAGLLGKKRKCRDPDCAPCRAPPCQACSACRHPQNKKRCYKRRCPNKEAMRAGVEWDPGTGKGVRCRICYRFYATKYTLKSHLTKCLGPAKSESMPLPTSVHDQEEVGQGEEGGEEGQGQTEMDPLQAVSDEDELEHFDQNASAQSRRGRLIHRPKKCRDPDCEPCHALPCQTCYACLHPQYKKRCHKRRCPNKEAERAGVEMSIGSSGSSTGTGVRCDICGQFYANKYTVKSHMLKCVGAGKSEDLAPKRIVLQCDTCKEKFASERMIRAHFFASQHAAHKPKYVCKFCQQTYASKGGVYLHYRLAHRDEL